MRAQWASKYPRLMVLDGAMGTELERAGIDIGHELWSTRALIQHPTAVRDVVASYVKAGAAIVGTATYQLSAEACARFDPKLTVTDVVQRAVAIAVEGATVVAEGGELPPRRAAIVGGCIGPVGSSLIGGLEYTGVYPPECATNEYYEKFHEERVRALLTATPVAPDLLMLETMPRLDEVIVLLWLIKKITLELGRDSPPPVFVALMVTPPEKEGDEICTPRGDKLKDAFAIILREFNFVVAVGCNCVKMSTCDAAFEAFCAATSDSTASFVCYPNSGEVFDAENNCWLGAPDGRSIASWFETSKMAHSGRRVIVGGCCRSTPERDIAGLSIVCRNLLAA